ncbi:MAG: hypothetical protein KAK00_00255 [Nanoarchaeota archaeon]|nr:hypothetical protein [Nanoarchaeota archaeon]
MPLMKIENWTGTVDTFTWIYNPITFNTEFVSNHTVTTIAYQNHHIIVSGGGIEPRSLVLNGHYSGASKWTNYRLMAKHFQETTKIKKLYFESDKFYLGIGKQCNKTNTGGRTNFIDYIATFDTLIGILLDNTEKTSGTNAGNVTTYITEISGTVTNGAVDITITDGTNSIKIPASALTTGHTFKYELVKMVDSGSGIFVSEYAYVELNGIQTNKVETTAGFGILKLAPATNVTTIVTTNITSPVKKFRDGWCE